MCISFQCGQEMPYIHKLLPFRGKVTSVILEVGALFTINKGGHYWLVGCLPISLLFYVHIKSNAQLKWCKITEVGIVNENRGVTLV